MIVFFVVYYSTFPRVHEGCFAVYIPDVSAMGPLQVLIEHLVQNEGLPRSVAESRFRYVRTSIVDDGGTETLWNIREPVTHSLIRLKLFGEARVRNNRGVVE